MTPACQYCEIFKNTYFEEHLRTAASKGETINETKFMKQCQEIMGNWTGRENFDIYIWVIFYQL